MPDSAPNRDESDAERGPNGHYYLDPAETSFAGYEGGDYRLKLATEDGKQLIAAVKPEHMEALPEAIQDTIARHTENRGDQ